MRVCQIIESTSGGSVRVALDVARGLAGRGEDVTFVYSPLRANKNFNEQMAGLNNVRFVPLPIKTSMGLHDLFATIRLVIFLIKTGPYDVIHAHSSKAGGLARLAGLFFPRMVVVYTPHAFVTMSPHASRLYGVIERLLSFCTDAIVAVSSYEKSHAVDVLSIKDSKLVVIPNAVGAAAPDARAQTRASLGFTDENFVIGFVGRLAEQKNVGRLVRSLSALHKQQPHVRCVIMGDGPKQQELEALIDQTGLSRVVTLLVQHEARDYYSSFDALLCSSDYEGFPLVFLEALTAGVPIVTTPVGGAPEAVIEGRTGFIARDFSDEALVTALSTMVRLTPQEKIQMKTSVLQHSKTFSFDRMIDTVKELYLSLIARKGLR